MTDCFTAIADPTRRQIIALLMEDDLSVNQLAETFEISRPAVSKHLRVLREANVVVGERHGREHIQRLNGAALQPVSDWVSRYAYFWDGKLAALKTLVEDEA